MRYSIVIPAFNEAESIGELYTELVAVIDQMPGESELLFVDDGSTDATPQRLAELSRGDKRVQSIRLLRNFGKSAAYAAGFDACRGEIIVTLDADLQDDPKEIPVLLAALDEGYDLVVGWKKGRLGNEPAKTIPSRVFNALKNLLFGLRLRDSNSGFRVMRRTVAERMHLYGNVYRFIPELAHQNGFRVGEVAVRHRQRKHGRSKYGMSRFWTGLLDLLSVRFVTAFMQKPLHFFGTLGLLAMAAGLGLEIYALVRKLLGDTFQTHIAAILVGVMLLLVGVQSIATGLIGEMISAQRRRRSYVVGE